jgi:hypothetical protein
VDSAAPHEKNKKNEKINIMEIGCENWRWTELAQDRVQWWTLVLLVLTRRAA